MSKMLMRDGEIITMQEEKKPLNGLTIAAFIIATATAASLGIGAVVLGISDEYKELKREIAESGCTHEHRRYRRDWDADENETEYRRGSRRRNRNNG